MSGPPDSGRGQSRLRGGDEFSESSRPGAVRPAAIRMAQASADCGERRHDR
jgi:hypothetical protein